MRLITLQKPRNGLGASSDRAQLCGIDAPEALADHWHGFARLASNPSADLAEILPACQAPLLQRATVLAIVRGELGIDCIERPDLHLGQFEGTDGMVLTISHNPTCTNLGY